MADTERNPFTGQPGKWVEDPEREGKLCFVETGSGRVFHDDGAIMHEADAVRIAQASLPRRLLRAAQVGGVREVPEDTLLLQQIAGDLSRCVDNLDRLCRIADTLQAAHAASMLDALDNPFAPSATPTP